MDPLQSLQLHWCILRLQVPATSGSGSKQRGWPVCVCHALAGACNRTARVLDRGRGDGKKEHWCCRSGCWAEGTRVADGASIRASKHDRAAPPPLTKHARPRHVPASGSAQAHSSPLRSVRRWADLVSTRLPQPLQSPNEPSKRIRSHDFTNRKCYCLQPLPTASVFLLRMLLLANIWLCNKNYDYWDVVTIMMPC